jgi:O-antigen/teichoic acid export membrane protein
LYLVGTVIPALGAIIVVNRHIEKPLLSFSSRPREMLQGLYFAVSLSAQTIYNDIDKVMLARLAGLAPAGLYGAAYRIVDVACTPLGAMLAASYSRFFQHGANGLRFSVRFARKLLPTTLLFGTVCTLSLVLAAPLLLPLLGPEYAEAVTAVRWLAPIVLLRCIHYVGADAMSGGDRQGLRTSLQVIVAIVNVILNLLVLPRYSWQGAVGTSLACDALLAVLVWLAIWRLSNAVSPLSLNAVSTSGLGAEAQS